MEVIFLKKVANLGNIGDRVKVKSGYGRNYLLPTGRATLVTPKNVVKFEAMRVELEKKAAQDLSDAETRATVLKDYKLTVTAKAGNEGKLFGSVGTADIADALSAAGHAVERAEVRLPEGPIRLVGEHAVTCLQQRPAGGGNRRHAGGQRQRRLRQLVHFLGPGDVGPVDEAPPASLPLRLESEQCVP